ncbi:hypothetical protein Glove_54g118 [Diversispora epigaea]|uniref:Ion transport domain-containing protein n=1 Tax=Diversispora epigaea TaxID=1348612 RepID=A0A397JCR7_9GLOM|nr:hypothetical protein Glove_54g118 [Diversispora epigaea]
MEYNRPLLLGLLYGFAMPDDHKPCTSVEDRTLFTVTHYQDCEHYFTVFLKIDSLRFKFVTSDKLRFANFYAINDQIFYQACSFDLFSVWATPTQPQKSGNVSRTTPHNDVKNILKSRRKSHYSISEPASSTPITPTFPIESISATHDITSASLSQPSNTLNKNMFQVINHDSNKKISEDFHNLDSSSFISFTKIKDVATETNTGSVQNIKALILSKTSRYSENQFTNPKISPTKEKKISLKDHCENYSWLLFSLLRIFWWPRKSVINDTNEKSPLLRVIHEEKDYEIYRTPTIMAVLDFKWSAAPLIALVTWLELEGPGRFIHIINSISKTILPFLAVMFIVIIAFGHAMFILLNYSDELQIPTYKIEDTTDLYSNIIIHQVIDKSSRLDNYYSNFFSSVEAVLFWTNGRWDQLDQWNNYGIDVISILGSIILVLIFQNMLIAFMNDAFDKANKEGHIVAYKHHAQLIAEYDALEKPFGSKRGNPRYIYYIPNPDMINTWLKETKKDEKHLDDDGHNSENDEKHLDCNDNDDDNYISDDNDSHNSDNDEKHLDCNDNDDENYIKRLKNVCDQLSKQEIRFREQEKRFYKLEQNIETILKTLNKLDNPE